MWQLTPGRKQKVVWEKESNRDLSVKSIPIITNMECLSSQSDDVIIRGMVEALKLYTGRGRRMVR